MNTKQKKNDGSFLAQGAILAAAGIITKLIGAAYRIPINNIIGDEGQGFYGYAFEIYSLALLLTSYSMPLAVSKLVSARIAMGERKNAYRVFKGALVLATCAGLTVGLVIFLGSDYIAKNIMTASLSAYALRVLAPGLLIVAILGVFRGYFQGLGTMIPTAVSQVLEATINATVGIIGASYMMQTGKEMAKAQNIKSLAPAYGAAGATFGVITSASLSLLFLFLIFRAYKKILKRQMERCHSKYTESYKDIFVVLLMTIAPVILSTAMYNISQSLDQFMFSRIMKVQGHSSTEYVALLGMFSGKYNTLINVPIAMANALGASVIPSLTAAVVAGSKANIKVIHNKIHMAIRFAMLIAIPSCIGYLVLSYPIIDLLYNGNIKIPSIMLRIGAITVVFYCLSTITNAILQGINRMQVPVKNAAISLVIHLLSLFLMLVVLKLGIYAVVISNIVFSLSMCILNSRALEKYTGYIQEQRRTFVIPGIAAAIMGVIAFIVNLILGLFIPAAFATIFAIFAAIVAYIISLLKLGGLSEHEILSIPKGTALLALFQKLHLMKQEYD